MRYTIRLSYDGSKFSGWQIQTNSATIQEAIEKALSTLCRQPVAVTGAGRTDTGVNAINYIAHFELSDGAPMPAEQLSYKLNAILPKEIVIHEIKEASEDFHARFGATCRRYRYFVHFSKDPFCEKFSYRSRIPLNVEAMNKAAAHILGTHDFSCFEKTGGNNATSICTVTKAEWLNYKPSHAELMGFPYKEGDYIVFCVEADRFLRNMVRAIVGSLIEVGKGNHEPDWIAQLIRKGSRSEAGMSVPGNALFFSGAEYQVQEIE